MPVPVVDWSKIPPRTVIPGFHGRFAHSEHMTFALWDIEAGARLPAHHHPHEQVIHVLSGAFEATVDGITQVLTAGMVGIVGSNLVHSGRALTTCRILDAFSPVREDYRDALAGAKPIIAGVDA
jgi:quercetin dioxygenase-like cupin family protein